MGVIRSAFAEDALRAKGPRRAGEDAEKAWPAFVLGPARVCPVLAREAVATVLGLGTQHEQDQDSLCPPGETHKDTRSDEHTMSQGLNCVTETDAVRTRLGLREVWRKQGRESASRCRGEGQLMQRPPGSRLGALGRSGWRPNGWEGGFGGQREPLGQDGA